MDVSAVYREGNGDLSINNWDSYKKKRASICTSPQRKDFHWLYWLLLVNPLCTKIVVEVLLLSRFTSKAPLAILYYSAGRDQGFPGHGRA